MTLFLAFASRLSRWRLPPPCASAAARRQSECAAPRLENTVQMEPIGDQGEVAVPITINGTEKKFLFDTGGGAMNYV